MLNDADRKALIMNASGAVNENWNVFKIMKRGMMISLMKMRRMLS